MINILVQVQSWIVDENLLCLDKEVSKIVTFPLGFLILKDFYEIGIIARRKARVSASSKSRDPLNNDSGSNNGEDVENDSRREKGQGSEQLVVQSKIAEKYKVLNKIGDG